MHLKEVKVAYNELVKFFSDESQSEMIKIIGIYKKNYKEDARDNQVGSIPPSSVPKDSRTEIISELYSRIPERIINEIKRELSETKGSIKAYMIVGHNNLPYDLDYIDLLGKSSFVKVERFYKDGLIKFKFLAGKSYDSVGARGVTSVYEVLVEPNHNLTNLISKEEAQLFIKENK